MNIEDKGRQIFICVENYNHIANSMDKKFECHFLQKILLQIKIMR